MAMTSRIQIAMSWLFASCLIACNHPGEQAANVAPVGPDIGVLSAASAASSPGRNVARVEPDIGAMDAASAAAASAKP
jgi:hypothetical protein